MSADDDGPGNREVAWRVFAAEYDDADHSYSEGDRERAPNYVVTPTGGRVNRLFVVGVLTAVESVSDDVVRARVVDPTGAFVVYAGQYQPEPLAVLESIDPPAFVAVTGKARTFQPDDADVVYTSIRPESVSEVDADARDRWVVHTAEATLDRVSTFADALALPERGDDLTAALSSSGVAEALADGIPRAIDRYGTTAGYLAALRDLSLDALRVVAGDREEVESLTLAPDEGGDADLDLEFSLDRADGEAEAETVEDDSGATATAEAATDSPEATTSGETTTGAEAEDDGVAAEPETTTEPETTDEETPTVAETAGEGSTDEVDPTAGDDGQSPTAAAADDGATAAGPADAGGSTASADGDGVPEGNDGEDGDVDDASHDVPPGADTDEMYEFDEEEREQIEEEYGTEFSTGNEIPDAGEADIDGSESAEEGGEEQSATGEAAAADEPADAGATPTEDEVRGAGDESDESGADEGDDAGTDESGADDAGTDDADEDETDEGGVDEADDGGTDEVPEDLESVVLDYMADLDDGDGADREALVAAVAGDYAVGGDEVEEAIQDALMSGQCFEPSDGVIKPI